MCNLHAVFVRPLIELRRLRKRDREKGGEEGELFWNTEKRGEEEKKERQGSIFIREQKNCEVQKKNGGRKSIWNDVLFFPIFFLASKILISLFSKK